jgi:hypothetical protein
LKYLNELVIPSVNAGAQKAGRTRADCTLNCAIFVVTGRNIQEINDNKGGVKAQIAFYASTPSYSSVMEMHGWMDLHQRLNMMSRQGRWFEMGDLISDEMLEHFAVIAPLDELANAVKQRYDGLLDRVGYYFPFELKKDADKEILWRNAAQVFAS